jgi:ribosomal protein L11 methyltransferase
MAAARIWPNPVLASDIDQVAVDVAQENVVANGLQGCVTCIEATGFDHPALAKAAPFDLIFANILKGPLIALAPDISHHITETGHVILSGLLNEQAADVLAAYRDQGFQSTHHQEIGEWTTLTLSKINTLST